MNPLGRLRRIGLSWRLRRRYALAFARSDPGASAALARAVEWLGCAQDNSASNDGGVACYYDLRTGWSASYPETTGYIICTLLDYDRAVGHPAARDRARRMLDWLVSIQLPDGGFQGGLAGGDSPRSTVFNTGQILLGLADGVREFDVPEYRDAMVRCADFLVACQDSSGRWCRNLSPASRGEARAYQSHVAWGLFEAARVDSESSYAAAAMANVRWVLDRQRENGWFDECCISDTDNPLVHTLAYALRGVLEAYRFDGDAGLLAACRRTADGMLSAMREDGFLAGRLDSQWRPAVDWACLTGCAQTAACWFILHKITGESAYQLAARRANGFLRRTVSMDGPAAVRGGVPGCFPMHGGYEPFRLPNWACKFFADSMMFEIADGGSFSS